MRLQAAVQSLKTLTIITGSFTLADLPGIKVENPFKNSAKLLFTI